MRAETMRASEQRCTAAGGGVDAMLRDWFMHEPGLSLLAVEQHTLNTLLPELGGYHAAQLGMDGTDLLRASRAPSKLMAGMIDVAAPDVCRLGCAGSSMPFANACLDVMLLAHVLEFAPDPYLVLREADRVLDVGGHLLILSFNPCSLWGLWRLLLTPARRRQVPWQGQFFRPSRIHDWLALLGMTLKSRRSFHYLPPWADADDARYAPLEAVGRRLWPALGNGCVTVACKRTIPLTSARNLWRKPARMVPAGAMEPSASHCGGVHRQCA